LRATQEAQTAFLKNPKEDFLNREGRSPTSSRKSMLSSAWLIRPSLLIFADPYR
jgi:hypothetical protein